MTIPILFTHPSTLTRDVADMPIAKHWASSLGFTGKPGSYCLVPNAKGGLHAVLAGVEKKLTPWSIAQLAEALPAKTFHLPPALPADTMSMLALGWRLHSYRFFAPEKRPFATLRYDDPAVNRLVDVIFFARDLINQPANLLTPMVLAQHAQRIAKEHGGACTVILADALLAHNYPLVHAVGRASENPPCLVDLRWGSPEHPKLTLVGKGVCFDSGGLDIKASSNMKLMKKDMGGAACVLALAYLIMAERWPVRLRVLIPAVENAVGSRAFRPLDIITARDGRRVEIGNTDAEGRLILADALTEADSEAPDMLIDCATLTGAARTALGTDIPALFTPSNGLARRMHEASRATHDPLWRLPLWEGYRDMLNTAAADINSAPDSGYAGAITAALFLRSFVKRARKWMHIDMMAWNLSNRPGRPQGGEAMGLRALAHMLRSRYVTPKDNNS